LFGAVFWRVASPLRVVALTNRVKRQEVGVASPLRVVWGCFLQVPGILSPAKSCKFPVPWELFLELLL